jgi:8-oxo-dGTP pyrophosphatase MutT (NUDIX family)
MKSNWIRPLAICIFSYNHSILVFEGYDPIKNQTFYRPLGGGIEFGETSAAALVREVREELGAEIGQLHYLGTLESIYIYNGQAGHEIVQIYDAQFIEPMLYRQPVITCHEDDGSAFEAVWKPVADFRDKRYPLYPNGLFELLQQHGYLYENENRSS